MSKPLTKYEYRLAVASLVLLGIFALGGTLWTVHHWANAGKVKVVYSE